MNMHVFDKNDREEIKAVIFRLLKTDLEYSIQEKIIHTFVMAKSLSYYNAGAKWGILKFSRVDD